MPVSLYRRILGAEFELLPEPLQRFHGSPSGGVATGSFLVERGPGVVRHLLARLGGLPPAAANVPLRLAVETRGAEELWTRSFGAIVLRTRQFESGGRLIELHPPWKLRIRLAASGGTLALEHERCYFCGLPLPRFLAPRVDSLVEARGERWFVAVTIGLPLVGMVCRYSGEVQPA